jgi:hypothetical protein
VPIEAPKQDAAPAPDGDSGRTWSGIVQESVVEGDMAGAP